MFDLWSSVFRCSFQFSVFCSLIFVSISVFNVCICWAMAAVKGLGEVDCSVSLWFMMDWISCV